MQHLNYPTSDCPLQQHSTYCYKLGIMSHNVMYLHITPNGLDLYDQEINEKSRKQEEAQKIKNKEVRMFSTKNPLKTELPQFNFLFN